MAKRNQDWRIFEALVERLQRAFNPHATIVRNDRLKGCDTERSREIDISIRYTLGTTNLLIVVDCKKYVRKIDLPVFDAFTCLMNDVRANAGIMVCEKGFSKAVKKLAAKKNIELFTFQDTERPNWQVKIRVPVCVDQWILTPIELSVHYANGTIDYLPNDEGLHLNDVGTGKKMTAATLCRVLWDEHPDKKDGSVAWEFDSPSADAQKFRIGFEAKRERFTRWATLSLVGLTNVADGLTYTDKFDIKTSDESFETNNHENSLLPPGNFPFGVLVSTTVVKSVELEKSGIDLKKNFITLAISGKHKPISLKLPGNM